MDLLKRDTVSPQECEDYKRVLDDFKMMQDNLYDCIASIQEEEFSFNEHNPKNQEVQIRVSNHLQAETGHRFKRAKEKENQNRTNKAKRSVNSQKR